MVEIIRLWRQGKNVWEIAGLTGERISDVQRVVSEYRLGKAEKGE